MTEQIMIVDRDPANVMAQPLKAAFLAANEGQGKLDDFALTLPGMSGRKYRSLINTLIGSLPDARYMEVGTWAGSTLCSAIQGNAVRALAIDNWSQFGGPASDFLSNLARCRNPASKVSFLEMDFREVPYGALGKFNVFLFDGPHEVSDQQDGLSLALPALDRQFVLIVDDWNHGAARTGTRMAIESLHLSVDYSIEIRTTLDGSHPVISHEKSDWHNGYFIAAITSPGG